MNATLYNHFKVLVINYQKLLQNIRISWWISIGILTEIIIVIWTLAPSYTPSNVATLFGGGKPIDGGMKINDKRVLGDGKTWRGLILGSSAGLLTGIFMNIIHSYVINWVPITEFSILSIFGLAVGAMLGDMTASLIKRRLGKERGAAIPIIDQIDALTGAIILTTILDPTWFTNVINPTFLIIAFLITPILDILADISYYILGLKKEPW